MKSNIANYFKNKKAILAVTMSAVLVFSSIVVSKGIQRVKAESSTTVATASAFLTALSNYEDSDIIKLSSDITINVTGRQSAISLLSGKRLIIDLNGHNLNYNYFPDAGYRADYALQLSGSLSELILARGEGSFNINSVTGGVKTSDAARCDVTNIEAVNEGAFSSHLSHVEVRGNLRSTGSVALKVEDSGAEVLGNVIGQSIGVSAKTNSIAAIHGSITVNDLTNGLGVFASGASYLHIDGGITAAKWANLDNTDFGSLSYRVTSSQEGYREYTLSDEAGTSHLFVRIASSATTEPATSTTEPAISTPPPSAEATQPPITLFSGGAQLVNSSVAYIKEINVSNSHDVPIDEIGVIYSKNSDMSNPRSARATKIDPYFNSYTAILGDLDPDTTYYYMGYVDADGHRFTGAVRTLRTTMGPKIATGTATNITSTSAKITNNTYNSTSYALVPTDMGVNYGTTEDFSGSIRWTSSQNFASPFETVLTGLQPNTKYWYEFYINEGSTGKQYRGARLSFTTDAAGRAAK